jgi:hypothetical protein
MFRSETFHVQRQSPLMALPTEIGLNVFDFLDSSSQKAPSDLLAVVATCCKLYDETITIALRNTSFYLSDSKASSFKFDWGLQSLGHVQQNLRNIRLQIQMDRPGFTIASNPFTLTTLPLNNLEIDFGMSTLRDGTWSLAYTTN